MKRAIPTCAALLAPLAFGAITGCRTLTDLVIQNPTYRIEALRPRVDVAIPFSASAIEIDLGIEVNNPNPVGLRLDQLDFDLLVDGTRLVTGVSNQDVRIPAAGRGLVDLELRIGYSELQTLFREIATLIQGGRPTYELRGTAYYDTPAGRLRFPLTVYRSGD